MSASAFSSPDNVITRHINCSLNATQEECLLEVYEIDKCVKWITSNSFHSIALQFPDELLVDAPSVASSIQHKVSGVLVFILGDTSYGSCCVDEVGAQHYKADCIIHYGGACLSPTARLPVLYVFGHSNLDIDDCVTKLTTLCDDQSMRAVLVYDTSYQYVIDVIIQRLRLWFKEIILSQLQIPGSEKDMTNQPCPPVTETGHSSDKQKNSDSPPNTITDNPTQDPVMSLQSAGSDNCVLKCGRSVCLPEGVTIDNYSFLFIGDTSGPTLTNMMMTFNKCPFYSYNPHSLLCQRETLNVNKALMKRYYLIERAKDANIVGIVAGTLGVAKYKDMMDQLRVLLKKSGKKSYTFVVGKLNPEKLANFAEVDIYVLVACPESSLLDQAEFYQPVVTPFEMEIACNQAREWTGDYSTDFSQLLPGASMYVEAPGEQDEERVDVSLITNKLRVTGAQGGLNTSDKTDHSVVLRSDAMAVEAVAGNAGEFLAGRSWRGLEQNLGETPVSKAVEGQTGIAAGYQNEPTS